MQTRRLASALGILMMLSFGVPAEQPATIQSADRTDAEAEAESADLDQVTVTARRRREILQERINAFVSLIAVPSYTEGMARWQVALCPLVAGASPGNAAYIKGRVSQVATDAGIPLAAKKCPPNFVIILTPEPETLLRDWWAESPRLFNKDRGVAPIDRFIDTEETVRVWYNACSVPPGSDFVLKGNPDCGIGQLGSKLTFATVRAIYSVIVVIDFERIKGTNVGQLADYVAMVGLAQIRRDADLLSLPTILNLFADGTPVRPQGMTSWDKSFLKSLYATESGNVTQISQIKSEMQRDLVP